MKKDFSKQEGKRIMLFFSWIMYVVGQVFLGYMIIRGAEHLTTVDGTAAFVGGLVGFVGLSIINFQVLKEYYALNGDK